MVIVVTNCLKYICDDFLTKEEYKLFYPGVIEIINCLKNGLRDRFAGVEYSKTFSLCTLLDPRFKLVCFKSEHAIADLKKHTHLLTIGLINKAKTSADSILDAAEENLNTTAATSVSAWQKFDDLLKKTNHKRTLKRGP